MSRASCCEMRCCISTNLSAVLALAAVYAAPWTRRASRPAATAVSCEAVASSTWFWSAMALVAKIAKSLSTREPERTAWRPQQLVEHDRLAMQQGSSSSAEPSTRRRACENQHQ